MAAHATFSPSAASRWLRCPGSIKLSEGIEDEGSAYAAEGTAAHEAAAFILQGQGSMHVPTDMLVPVTTYTDLVHNLVDARPGCQVFIEQRLEFSDTIGVPDSFGTADCIILHDDEIVLVDLKYGMGVKVEAEENEQLMLYALAAIEQFGSVFDAKRVTLVICQPRLDHTSEWTVSAEDLEHFAKQVRAAVQLAQEGDPRLVPGEKQCRFCKAKASCPALAKFVSDAVDMDFEVLDERVVSEVPGFGLNYLSHCMHALPLVEDWCRAIRARVEKELFAGNSVDGYKLVAGRAGPRKWSDMDGAVDILDTALGDKAYNVELISPTAAEKALKGSPAIWAQLQPIITRSEGSPSVAPLSDKRPAISPAASPDDFNVIT